MNCRVRRGGVVYTWTGVNWKGPSAFAETLAECIFMHEYQDLKVLYIPSYPSNKIGVLEEISSEYTFFRVSKDILIRGRKRSPKLGDVGLGQKFSINGITYKKIGETTHIRIKDGKAFSSDPDQPIEGIKYEKCGL